MVSNQLFFITSKNVQVEVLRSKMEDLSKGTLLERMREECRSMLSTTATSSAASSKIRTEHPESSMPKHLHNLVNSLFSNDHD